MTRLQSVESRRCYQQTFLTYLKNQELPQSQILSRTEGVIFAWTWDRPGTDYTPWTWKDTERKESLQPTIWFIIHYGEEAMGGGGKGSLFSNAKHDFDTGTGYSG